MGKAKNPSRRTFLKASAVAGGGLVIGFYLPSALRWGQGEAAPNALFEPNIWLRIAPDDSVTIVLTQLEMGQGAMTAMPMLVAEELDADWNKVKLEWAPADRAYGNPGMGGRQSTAGSRSVRGFWKPLREAGAAARAMLVAAAAQSWGVPENTCSTEKGEVLHQASGRRLRYGALVEKAAGLPVPKQVSLKDQKDFRLLGQSLPRLDIPEKVNGSAVFGMDVKVPNMLVARVARCPVFGGKLASFKADKAKAIVGVRHVLPISSGVAVVADSFWAATQGLQAVEISWDEGPNAGQNSANISKQFAELSRKPGAAARDEGDVNQALARAVRTIEATYEVPFLAHACMEPMNCTADVRRDRCEVWAPTQSQTSMQEAAVRITGLPPQAVKVHTTYLGGGFGRRGEGDFVSDAVETSKAIGQPVKAIWTREDDIQHDFYRPAAYNRLSAALDGQGMPIAWLHRVVSDSIAKRIGRLQGDVDPLVMGGAVELPYNIPNIRVEYILHETGIPVGFWRSVPHSVHGFVTESFLDEVAAAGGKDPYELRLQLLDNAPRHKAVLELAATQAGWGKPLPQGRFRGVAVHESFGSFVAQVAEVSVSANGAVRVHRVVAAVDCGVVIHPDTVKAQVEGSIVYGLTAALKGEITIENGRVKQSNFHDYPMLRMNEMPEVEVHIVPSTETPGGMGEPGVPPIAAAVVNAIFAATGKRIRRLPIRAEELRSA
ncbi:MAG: xanthine dehydrogenase family protein molybdopterin-binding subunit [Acidobacteria bacterium]|nr:xanthine dehydrogenase family protein molybdopterin-binding subunit [Acidobacteriota bacterium]